MSTSNPSPNGRPYFEYRYVVGFKDTNLVGNVYFTRHLEWQGMCREMFVREHAPGVLPQLESGLCFVTLHASCDYRGELRAFDEVVVRMRLAKLRRNRAWMEFEYLRPAADGTLAVVAEGRQTIGCMRRAADGMLAEEFPAEFLRALEPYRGAGPVERVSGVGEEARGGS